MKKSTGIIIGVLVAVLGALWYFTSRNKASASTAKTQSGGTNQQGGQSVITNISNPGQAPVANSNNGGPITSGYYYNPTTGQASSTPSQGSEVIPSGSIPYPYPDPNTASGLAFYNTPGITITPDVEVYLNQQGFVYVPGYGVMPASEVY